MITTATQRWRNGRHVYRPAGETIRASDFEVASIDRDRVAKDFVVAHHYAASYPAARFRFGLYRRGELAGVAVFSHPANNATLRVFPCATLEATELGRLVLLDEVHANGESWFIARCFELLRREGIAGVVSFSDPMPRTDAMGATVFRGHIGTIYQATNAIYAGRARADTMRLLPDGRTLHNRALAKLRARDRGWRYVVEQLEAQGAASFDGDVDGWLARELPRITRKVRHPGNHRYLFALDKRVRRHLPASLPYPKVSVAA